MPPWRNRLARSAVNRKVGGSSPPGGEKCFTLFCRHLSAFKIVLPLKRFLPSIDKCPTALFIIIRSTSPFLLSLVGVRGVRHLRVGQCKLRNC